jgi:isocitrate dehydrogenase (NAD+)
VANPTALLQSALLMLDHLGESGPAARIRAALGRVFTETTVRTRDLGGTASTTAFTDEIVRLL